IQTLFARANGSVLVGTSAGLQIFNGDQFTPPNMPTGMFPGNRASIAETSRGLLWLGTLDGLFQVDNDGRQLNVALPNSRVSALRIDREGALWIATAG